MLLRLSLALQGRQVLHLLSLAQRAQKGPRGLRVEVAEEELAIRGRRVQQEQLQIRVRLELQARQVV